MHSSDGKWNVTGNAGTSSTAARRNGEKVELAFCQNISFGTNEIAVEGGPTNLAHGSR
jgi:hypothetical protein